jgi:DNA-binding MarR family transcriptional regulator
MLTGFFRMIKPSREVRQMAVLAEIARNSGVSQRGLARVAGVSATMVNAYIDDLLSRGLLDVTGETNRTYRYYITPAGRSHRQDLFREFSREVFELHERLSAPEESPESRSA